MFFLSFFSSFSPFFFVELDKLLDLNTFTFRLDLCLRPPKRDLYSSNYFLEESHTIYFNKLSSKQKNRKVEQAGSCKWYIREHCEYSIQSLRKILQAALESMVQLRLRNMYIKVIVRLLMSQNGSCGGVRGGHVIEYIIVLYYFGKLVSRHSS
jgi:hypothetical protein